MTKREWEILEILKENPMISQKDLAEKLGITRSSVAGHIMNLTNKGQIQGKGYILRKSPYAVVIGGSNMDIQGFPSLPLISRDSNPGRVKVSCGGVARNIAENMARLGAEVKLLTVLGDDSHGQQLIEESTRAGIDMSDILIIPDKGTSSYLSILNEKGDMALALSDMEIMESFTVSYIQSRHRQLSNASVIVLDANIPEDVISYICRTYRDIPIFADPVSSAKASRLTASLPFLHTIKPNAMEAQVLTGLTIENEQDLEKAAGKLREKGVRNVVISLNDKGIFSLSEEAALSLPNPPRLPGPPVNATGAGDAFLAGLAWGLLEKDPLPLRLQKALAASGLTICHENTINPNISAEKIDQFIKENY